MDNFVDIWETGVQLQVTSHIDLSSLNLTLLNYTIQINKLLQFRGLQALLRRT